MTHFKWIASGLAALIISSFSATSNSSDVYHFVAIELNKPANFVSNDNKKIDFSYAQSVSVGLGADYDLSTH